MDFRHLINRTQRGGPLRLCETRTLPLMILVIMAGTSGCATTGDDGFWERLAVHSRTSIQQESVWVPLAAAAVFAGTSADEEVSEWAVDRNPVFGSPSNAGTWSDWLSGSVVATALITSFAWRDEANQPITTDLFILGSAYAFSDAMKRVADRTRPDEKNDLSFPSLHATMAFTGARIAARNFSTRDTRYGKAIRIALFTFASGSAWGRVEAEKHYPADVLAGAAVGNFFAGVGNGFLEDRESITVSYAPMFDGGVLQVHWLFP